MSSHNLKSLLIKNHQLLHYSVEEDLQLLQLTSISQLLNPKLIFNRKLSIINNKEILNYLLQIQLLLDGKQQIDLHYLAFKFEKYADI